MNKYLFSAILLSVAAPLAAQQLSDVNLVDATRFGSTDISGTARYRSMAGAFGALGGDVSAMTDNPAGMGIYRGTSSAVFTPNLSIAHTKTTGDQTKNSKKADCSVTNLAYVVSFRTPSAKHLVNLNFGMGFNHSAGMNRKYRMAFDNSSSSFGDYLANRANNSLIYLGKYDQPGYMKNEAWNDITVPISTVLAYDCFAIDDAGELTDPNDPNSWKATGGVAPTNTVLGYQRLIVKEKNRNDEYNFSLSANWEDFLYGGFTLTFTDFNSTIQSGFREDFDYDYLGDYTTYENDLETKGSGVGIKMGLLIKPTDCWRMGVAVHTPTWTSMKDIRWAYMEVDNSSTWNEVNPYTFKYRYNSPWEYQFSSAWVVGKRALISLEYDMKDFSSMKYKVTHDDDIWGGNPFADINSAIKDYSDMQHTFKAGMEYRLNEHWSARLGYAYKTSPYKEEIFENKFRHWTNGNVGDDNTLCFDSSTKPNYALLDNQNYYTAGFGWSNSHLFLDMSFMGHSQKEKIAAYPTTSCLWESIKGQPAVYSTHPNDGATTGDYLDLKTFTLHWDLTFGLKF